MTTPNLYQQIQTRLPKWARNNILTGLCGSHTHGTYISPEHKHGTDDLDVFQIVVHPRDFYMGLDYYQHKEDTYQTHGESLDILVHDLPKFVYLLTQGNPNVHSYLWLEPQEYLDESLAGHILIDQRERFMSQRMFLAFGGYAYAQLKRMTHGEHLGYMGLKRKELMNEYGYDIKNAAHCIRLFLTGIYLAKNYKLKVKFDGPDLDLILSIKRGEKSAAEVERIANDLNEVFLIERKKNDLPKEVERTEANKILANVLEISWQNFEGGY